MSHINDFFQGVSASFEWIKAKIGTVLLVVFIIGMFAGRHFALNDFSIYFYLAPILAIPIMWRDLDEGAFALAVFFAIAWLLQ